MCATAATPLVTLIHGVEPPGEPVSNWVGSSGDMVPDLGRWCTAPSPQPGRLRDLRFAILGNGGHVFLASGEMSAPRAGTDAARGACLLLQGLLLL